MADTVVVNAAGPGSDDFPRKCIGESLVRTSSTVCYFFYVDSANDLVYIKSTNAGVNFWSKRFFIFSTTVFKFYELRGGGPAGNRATIIRIDCDFAKPGRRARREMYDARAILAVVRIVKPRPGRTARPR